jgi:hypothetical protein
MDNKVIIIEDKCQGIFNVCHEGNTIADFYYSTDISESKYLSRDTAKKLAKKVARYLLTQGTFTTIAGVTTHKFHIDIING